MSEQSKTSPIKEEKQEQEQQPQAPPLPPPPLSSSQEQQPEEKGPQAEEKRPLETSCKEEDVHSSKERKTEETDSPGKARDRNRDTGLVLPPEPYVMRLLNDRSLQIRLLQGFLDYFDERQVFPFSNQNSLQDFLTNWLQVTHVQLGEFMEAVRSLWVRYEMTAFAVGPNIQSLTLVDREIFLLSDRIWALQSEDDDPVGNVPSMEDNKRKAVKIGESLTETEKGKGVKNVESVIVTDKGKGVKNVDSVVVTDKGKGVRTGDSDQTGKKYNKGKEKMVLVFKRKEKRNKYVLVVKGKEEKPKGKESEEKPKGKESEEKGSQVLEKPLNDLDTDTRILNGLLDYFFSVYRYPFDDFIAMEDFVKNWLKMDISVGECMLIIKKLKRKYKKQARNMDVSFEPRDTHADQMFNMSEVIWGNEDPNYDSSEGERSDDNEEEEAKEIPNRAPTFGSEDLDHELGLYGFGSGELKGLMPVMVKNTIMADTDSWLRSIMAPYTPASLDYPKPEEKEKQSVHSDDAKQRGTMDKNDPSPTAPEEKHDPGEPHDQGDDAGRESNEEEKKDG